MNVAQLVIKSCELLGVLIYKYSYSCMISGSEVTCIGYSYRDVAIVVCRKAVAAG